MHTRWWMWPGVRLTEDTHCTSSWLHLTSKNKNLGNKVALASNYLMVESGLQTLAADKKHMGKF